MKNNTRTLGTINAKEKPEKASVPSRAVERAYDYLHRQAVGFGFKPEERINEVEVAGILDMSRAPVREALNRLVMNGLVVFEAGKGFFCRKLSIREISELFEIRSDLETAGMRSAVRNATDAEIRAARESWAELVERQNEMDIETLVNSDEQFHLHLMELAGNSERVKYMRNINERIRFVRRINLESEKGRATTLSEHTHVLDALFARDGERAAELMALHLKSSSAELRSHVHEGIARIFADKMT
jgi:DNA-binding GntR family transcriptional regulator